MLLLGIMSIGLHPQNICLQIKRFADYGDRTQAIELRLSLDVIACLLIDFCSEGAMSDRTLGSKTLGFARAAQSIGPFPFTS